MSVTVYPYLTEPAALQAEKSKNTQQTAPDREFDAALSAAERNLQARSVDALIRRSESGSVSVETIQRILGFNPAAKTAAAGGVNQKAPVAEKTEPKTASAAGTGACTPELDAYFAEAAARYNVDVNLLKAIAKAESGYDPSATSGAGAMGIMQLMPDTAAGLGIADAYNPYDNIMGGAKVIADYIQQYSGDLSMALAAYNAGPGNVEKYNGVPPFDETKNYVKKVLDYYQNVA